MIAAYLRTAAARPLDDQPSARWAEIRHIAERDRCSLFAAAMEQWCRDRTPDRELPL